jgi:cysteine-rich repeat protein
VLGRRRERERGRGRRRELRDRRRRSGTVDSSTGISATDDTSSGSEGGVDSSATIGSDVCGDGRIDPGEECDDGNGVDGDACSSDCLVSFVIEWTQTYDGPYSGADMAHAVAVDANDAIWVLGRRQSADGDTDLWLRRYAPDGSTEWTFVSLGAEGLGASGLRLGWTPDDRLAIVGSTRSATTEGDIFILVLDPVAESVVWSRAIDGPGSGPGMDEDGATSVDVAPNGNVVVGGTVAVDGQGRDVWVGALSSDGDLLWEQTWDDGDAEDDFAMDVRVAADGTVEVLAVHTVSFAESVVLMYADDGTPLVDDTVDLAPLLGFAMSELSTGDVVVGGVDGVGLAVEAFDATWTDVWLAHGDMGHPNAVGEDSMGRVPAAGLVATPGAPDAWAGGFNGDGSPWWGDVYDGRAQGQDEWTGLAVDSQDDVIVVGYETTTDQGRNVLVRKYDPL